jgi:linoleoyl-CoA desaturase
MQKISFPNRVGFYDALNERVNRHFAETRLAKTGNWRMFLKTGIVLAWLVISYALLVFYSSSLILAIVFAFALSQGFVLVGLNVMHDGNHGSYSRNNQINRLMGFTLDLVGGSSLFWRQKHNILHHTYTNITEIDDDLYGTSLLRLCPDQKWRPCHRFQHLYAFLLYSLLSLFWVTYNDFNKLFSGRIGNYKLRRPAASEASLFFLAKLFYFGYMLVLPSFFHPIPCILITFVAIHLIMGFTLTMVFQLAHQNEGNTFPKPEPGTGIIENEWAIHQVETTANFAPNNVLAGWYLGGLNFQIEHHLFSRICHIHYPAISKIVKMTCEEFGISYTSFPTIRSAIAAHLRFLKTMGHGAPHFGT